jgi:hypothetical protein
MRIPKLFESRRVVVEIHSQNQTDPATPNKGRPKLVIRVDAPLEDKAIATGMCPANLSPHQGNVLEFGVGFGDRAPVDDERIVTLLNQLINDYVEVGHQSNIYVRVDEILSICGIVQAIQDISYQS